MNEISLPSEEKRSVAGPMLENGIVSVHETAVMSSRPVIQQAARVQFSDIVEPCHEELRDSGEY